MIISILYKLGIGGAGMDTRMIRYFLAIAEEENISKAAEKLHMSQPPLSRQLKQLEEELGVELFYRDKGRIWLTDAGYFLKERASEIVELMDKTEAQMRELYHDQGGNIYIGTIETAANYLLPKWISGFNRRYPNITYHVNNNNTDEIMKKIDNGVYDIGIVREPFNSEKYECIRLPEETWIACLPKNHALAETEETTINLAQLAGEQLILPGRSIHEEQIKKWFELLGTRPRVICWYTALINGLALAQNGLGILLCPKSAEPLFHGKENIVYKEIINPRLTSSVVVIWKRNKRLSTAVGQFIDYIREEVN